MDDEMMCRLLIILGAATVCSANIFNFGGFGCEGQTFVFACPRGYFISIKTGFYGRLDTESCLDDGNTTMDTQCSVEDAVTRMKSRCQSENRCDLPITAEVFGDPCPGTSKYMEVTFVCAEPEYSGLQCEGNKLSISCPEGFFINPRMSVMHGRLDATTCSHDSAIIATNCTSSTAQETVIQLCTAKKDCHMYVEKALFGDPCPGNYKYLQVNYSCSMCVNEYGDDAACDKWVSWGECDKNTNWMMAYCRKSCTGCDWKNSCANTKSDLQCSYWASIGECLESPIYMLGVCARSCNLCPDPELLTTTVAPDTPACNNRQDDKTCEVWYEAGECISNADWMLRECAAACTRCPIPGLDRLLPAGETCADSPEKAADCPSWVEQYQCYDNTDFMLVHCRKSCKVCFRPEVPCTNLYDNETKCVIWEVDGECNNTAKFMYINCRASCGLCHGQQVTSTLGTTKTGVTTTATITIATTVDADSCANTGARVDECDYWASIGDCENNAEYMRENCRKSCNQCQKNDITTSGPGGTTSTPTVTPTVIPIIPTTTPYLPEEGVTNTIICEGEKATLVCPSRRYLRIYRATFGRTSTTTCTDNREEGINTTSCRGPADTIEKFRDTCNGRPSCLPSAYTDAFRDPCPGTYKYLDIHHGCQDCTNVESDSSCEVWMAEGKCQSNRDWMYDNCYQSCSGCKHSNCGNGEAEADECDYWAMRGECGKNPTWMKTHCEESCRKCPTELSCDPDCGSNGWCRETNTCSCDGGYSGADCSLYSCQEVNDCGAHGACEGPNQCQCEEGWMGRLCEETSCDGVSNCNDRGRCVGPDICLCHPYWSGASCSDCFVGFNAGPSCLPCPNCVHGTCIQNGSMTSAYVGCQDHDLVDTTFTLVAWRGLSTTTSLSCMQTCLAHNYKYAATTAGDSCMCGDGHDTFLMSTSCDLRCSGSQDDDVCGGIGSYSVWRTHEGYCQCSGPNWMSVLCDQCAPGYEGANCQPISTASTTPPSTTTTPPTTKPTTPTTVRTTRPTTISTTPPTTTTTTTTTKPTTASTTTSTTPRTPTIRISTVTKTPPTPPDVTSTTEAPVAPLNNITVSSTVTSTTTTQRVQEIADNNVLMIVVLEKQWKDIYNDSTNDETSTLTRWITQKLLNFYKQTVKLDISGVQVKHLRPGSIIVDHVILLSSSGATDAADKTRVQCLVSETLFKQKGVMAEDLKAHTEDELVNNCAVKDDYCMNGATQGFDDAGYWTCDCSDSFSGPRCENTIRDSVILIVIIVVSLAVPLVLIIILCLVLPRYCYKNKAVPNTAGTPSMDNTNGTARSFEFHSMSKGTSMIHARKSANNKLFHNTTALGRENSIYLPHGI